MAAVSAAAALAAAAAAVGSLDVGSSTRSIKNKSYFVNHLFGESEPHIETLSSLYDELLHANNEHTDVSITHESSWCLSAFKSGTLIWENVEMANSNEHHMKNMSKEKTIELWIKLAQVRIEEINKELWSPGYD